MEKKEETRVNIKVLKKDLNIQRSRAICIYISKRPLLNQRALCNVVGYDSSNLLKCINNSNRHIPAHHLSDFERILKNYGFIPFENGK